jgi:hypothetical protein
MSVIFTHPIAAMFPCKGNGALDQLTADMKANGQYLPIVLYEGMIWDGRARYQVCTKLGLKPWLVPLRRKHPVEFYIQSNYDRVGEPASPERKAVVSALLEVDSIDHRTKSRTRRAEWIREARTEFEQFIRDEREPCVVCQKYVDFAHSHHSFPLSLKFDCGIREAIHEYQWLCPIHHKCVHVLLSGYLLGSRDLSFLDGISAEHTAEWLAVEESASKGVKLCCEALGQEPKETKPHRYDPPYSLFVALNPSLHWRPTGWKNAGALGKSRQCTPINQVATENAL